MIKLLIALAVVAMAAGCSDQINSQQVSKQRYEFVQTSRGDLYKIDKSTGETWMLEWEEEPRDGKMIRVVKGWAKIRSMD